MSQCVFCDILHGKVESSHVYEDDATFAFMNPKQLNDGHTLVIPKTHVETVDQLSLEMAGALFRTTVIIARAVQSTFRPEGMNIWQSNGEVAGQEIPHVHIRIFPRRQKDGFRGFWYETMPPSAKRTYLDQLALQIRHQIAEDLNLSRLES